jgi:Tfp pilus assembly protein FimT
MTTNETVLIIVTAVAALLLMGTLVGFAHQTRSRKRGVFGGSIREEIRAEALQTARSDAMARQQPFPVDAND